jgi:tetrahydromethanopterin S-methyltransferase subunit G
VLWLGYGVDMKEKEISLIINKFTKTMGPVAQRIADEVAKEMGILKDGKISPRSAEEYDTFIERIENEYAKIIGKDVVKTIMKL